MTRKELDALPEMKRMVVLGPAGDYPMMVRDTRIVAHPEDQYWMIGTYAGRVWRLRKNAMWGIKVPHKLNGSNEWRWISCETGEDLGPYDGKKELP